MRLRKFIVLNILMSIIEFTFVMLLTYHFLGELVMTFVLVLYIVLVVVQLLRTNRNNIFKEVELETTLFDKYLHLITETKKIKPDLQYKYIDLKELPNPAFYFRNTVYINKNAKTEEDFFEGMIAHELGHATTSLGDVVNIVVFRFSTVLSNMMYMFRLSLRSNDSIISTIFDYMYYLVYRIISIPDSLVLNNFIREDEYLANDYATTITDGRSLRTYYYKAYQQVDKKKIKYDLKHPKVLDMIARMETQMNLSEYEKDIYAVGKRIYYYKNILNNKDKLTMAHNYYLHCVPLDKDVAFKLALNYERGMGTKKDIEKAKEYFIKATDFKHKKAPYKLATLYRTENNIEKATLYFSIASQYNHKAYYELGLLYEELDIDKALYYYNQGALLHNVQCINKLKQLEIKEENH